MSEPKQILVWRNDLRNTKGEKVRTGKIAAQLSHASVGALLNLSTLDDTKLILDNNNPLLKEWLGGLFTKICVYVNSEQELLDLYESAVKHGINNYMVIDAGLTEFGKPTLTCLGLGPEYPEKLDPITRHLKLL